MTKSELIESIHSQFKNQGYILKDDLFSTILSYDFSVSDMEIVCKELLFRNILIRDEPIKSEIKIYDKSHTNYKSLFKKIRNKYPSQDCFLSYVEKILPPQQHETENLILQVKNSNPFARNRLFEMYLRPTIKIAFDFSNQYNLDFEDTLQDALIGLYESIDKFEKDKHNRFFSLAIFYIKNSIKRFMNINNTIFYLPYYIIEDSILIYDYLDYKNIEITAPEITIEKITQNLSQNFNIEKDKLKLIIRSILPSFSLDDDNFDSSIYFDSTDFFDLEDKCITGILAEKVYEILFKVLINTKLKHKELHILKWRAGYFNINNTLDAIGQYYGVTKERIRQLEKKSCKKNLRI